MKILKRDIRHGEIFVSIEDIDDLWFLSQFIDKGDSVKGRTFRKIKQVGKDDKTTKVEKRPVFLKLKVEKVEFHEYSDILRVSGLVEEGPDDVPKASHHTFNVEPGTKLTIIKEHWMKYQLERLDEASKTKDLGILICTLDREEVNFALLKKQGYKILSEFEGEVIKKADAQSKAAGFYAQIIKQLENYVARYKIKSVILASPAFWKLDLMKQIKDQELKSKITLATCNAVGKEAINEVLKRPEVKNILTNDRTAREIKIVDKLLDEISKNALAVYGIKQTENAVNLAAVTDLLVSTELIHEKRQEENFSKLDKLMQYVESVQGRINIINSKNPAGKKLDGLGGIAAILRYKIG